MKPLLPVLGDYLDPESNDWIPPSVPREADLPDNTDSFGPFYLWRGRIPDRQMVISLAITREIHPPWHHGFGLVVRWDRSGESYGYAVGVWMRGKPPRILTAEPEEKNLHQVIKRANYLDNLTG